MRLRIIWILLVAFLPIGHAWAQDDPEIEALYDRFEDKETQRREQRRYRSRSRTREEQLAKVSELGQLAPFDDIAVIQRRFLPKTGRFELSGSATLSTNNPYFNNFGASAKAAYYLNESWGAEVTYSFLSNAERDVTKNLEDIQNISTRSLVVPESYMGLSVKWVPIYGKMALFDRKIVPFDLYFSVGGGLSKTKLGESEPTISLATGQLFAISKSFGFRWDFMWNFYQADILREGSSGGTTGTVASTTNHNDLFLLMGVSYFFPEATYR